MQKAKRLKVTFNASGKRVGIVVSRFNKDITDELLSQARLALSEFGVKKEDSTVLAVPGSVEIPYALQKLAKTKKYDCLVALGCVIKGETEHFTYVCKMAQEGILRVMLDAHIPIGFGVITANSIEQAKARAKLGRDAVAAALELTTLKEK